MPSDKDTRKAIIKFAQLYNLFNQRRNKKYFDSVIQDLVDVNCQVPSNAYLELHKSHIIGYTALHIAVQMEQIEVVHRLLNQGIDFTMKNRSGSTALHDALQKSVNKIPGWKLNGRLDDSFIRPILSRHVATHNAINPSNECGITHFHVACMTNQTEAIELFLDKGVPVDHAVGQTLPVCPGYTGLHFAARCCGLEAMEILLKRGADAKAQDAKKMTPMQMIVENIIEMVEMIRSGNDEVYENITEDFGKNLRMMVLLMGWETSAVDSVGLSHVHVACTMRDTSVIERLLEQNVDVNQIVKVDSPVWPGYTPLHFAAMFNFEIVKLLLTKGANVEAKDAKGITPFQICLERYGFEEIHYLLSNHDVWQNVVLSDATTKLTDLVRAMGNLKEFESLLRNIDANQENRLNMHVAIDSPLWPGNTILHLAVIFYDMTRNLGKVDPAVHRLQMIEECLRLGSDVTITNADGYTPLHLAFRAGRDDAVEKMLQHHHSIDNPVDDSGLSHLHIACAANNKLSVVILLISSKSNVNLGLQTTFMWYGTLRNTFGLSRRCLVHLRSGSTPLHVAVTIGSAEIVELLLKHGASLYARDADGLTPIHCVLTSCDRATIGKTLLSARRPSVHECVTDSGLSHLHIASFVNSVHTITSLLEHGADVDLAIAGEFITNASVDACDNPFTFVNSLSITRNVDEPDNQISVTLDRDTPSDESVEGLIDPYGDPPIDPYGESDKYLKRYAGFTPLHFAMRANSRDAVHLLIDRGADILARSNGHTPLYDTLNCVYNYLEEFTTLLIADVALRERVRHDTGITMLHIACHRINIDMVRELLSNADTDINATINSDSPVWPGSTPLHVLLIMWENNFYTTTNVANMIVDVMVLLLNNGADVKKQNAQLDTPLHIADRIFFLSDAYPITSPAHTSVSLLLNKHMDFNVNPINNHGYSFFHIACRMNFVAPVSEYLNHGVDVNQPVDYFTNESAGQSPLILAAGSLERIIRGVEVQMEVVDVLLEYGADIQAEDAFRNTPLHAAGAWGGSSEILLTRLISHGADMYAKNIFGDTPFEVLLRSFRITTGEVAVFLRHGFIVNGFNDITKEGYMSILFSKRFGNIASTTIFDTIIKFTNIAQIDEKGRTAVHNIVSTSHPIISDDEYVDLFEQLTECGLDIDAQDETGKTALHMAAMFRNHVAVSGLLKSGADLNILDSNRKPAFAYFLESSDFDEDVDEGVTELTIKAFVFHIQKLQLCGLEFNQLNGMIRDRAIEKYAFHFDFYESFNAEREKLKKTNIGSRSFTLYDFLSETGAVSAYPMMTQLDRNETKEFFESTCKFTLHREFYELAGLLKLQYRKAVKRLQLVEPAVIALLGLTPYMLPDLCSEAILKYLSNSELSKLISNILQVEPGRKRIRIQ